MDVEITEDSDLPKVFFDLTPVMWTIAPNTLEDFKKQHGIIRINDWTFGPCGRGVFRIDNDAFQWLQLK